ncbi:regulation of nuclear pre-mRNA domain-containing protein 1B isoform X2 [Photinus pyralis]|nr:regulation of nuclear pre-mRNA domain-containing protein 1B isoform X2 [Photinus pyralis]XP_031346777.1 regulation of nuclear pre-mRNA domain-containing protein 1B isoform X2 [Photinus pyralis]
MKKLAECNNSTQSIQTLSFWLIHHRKHHVQIVKTWYKELLRAKDSKKLTFMYLANDVIQNSRKKGPEFGKEFAVVLGKAFEHLSSIGYDEKMKSSLGRLLSIWDERGIYDDLQLTEFKQALLLPPTKPPLKRAKTDNNGQAKKRKGSPNRERKKSETEVTVEVDGTVETHVHLSPRTPATDPPEPEELVKALQELEGNLASADEVVRQKVSQLPRSVSDITLLEEIQDRSAAERLNVQVTDAMTLIDGYNARLTREVELRKKVTVMLAEFLQVQKDLLSQAEQALEEYTDKLQKVFAVRHELKTHIRNLPDLTRLPDVTHGLSPLPSAGDLFKIPN